MVIIANTWPESKAAAGTAFKFIIEIFENSVYNIFAP